MSALEADVEKDIAFSPSHLQLCEANYHNSGLEGGFIPALPVG
jgi:hypothetical protein